MRWILASMFVIVSINMTVSTVEAGKPVRKTAAAQNSIQDVVKKVREDDEGVVVLFEKAAGSYYLRRDVADFDGCKSRLQNSLNSKKPVSVTVDSTQLNILEVK